MLIPAEEHSEMGLFTKIFADIGDQQSIEDDLSTYSSRLANMKAFLDESDKETLDLIDEFGFGIDPKIGGAIAEAILKQMNDQQIFGFITTHYSNLKIYAFKTKGLVNGSMLFDKEELSPTYQLKVGKPGSSYAFEIAEKSGLSKEILHYARHKTGKNEKAVDQLLVDLQREKQELEENLEKLSQRQGTLDKLITSYETMHKDLEHRRKRIKLSAKEIELQRTAAENKEMEKLVRKLKEEKNLEKAKELSKKSTGNTLYILDEPTTGLHFEDIKMLLIVLRELRSLGNTILVIEHNMDIIKMADHIIDMGPEAGTNGGEITAQGTFNEIKKDKKRNNTKTLKR